eukprot:COSAG06_NODE_20560_length_790_cov_85.484805_2_plen_39_part_01
MHRRMNRPAGWIGLIVLPLLKRLSAVAHVLWLTGAACAL